MRCLSASTTISDSYRAGCELGAALKPCAPEVVLIFASTTYESDFHGLFDGISDELNSTGVILFGCTGDGVYERKGVSHHGVAALGINTNGRATWAVEVEPGVDRNSFRAAQLCLERAVEKLDASPSFAMVLADGVHADGTQICAGAASVLSIPFIGGLAGDDRKFANSWVFVNGEAYQRSVATLVAVGEVPFLVNSASGWTPIGQAGQIEACEGNTITKIAGLSPQEFLRERLGKSPGEVDLGIVPLAAIDKKEPSLFFLRTPSHIDSESGSITTFGSIEQGTMVRVCVANQHDVVSGVTSAVSMLSSRGFKPEAAILVSCAGRRWLLEDNCRKEVELVLQKVGKDVPLIGFPSFGEIGPFRKDDGTYSATYFHNVTFIVCLLGTRHEK